MRPSDVQVGKTYRGKKPRIIRSRNHPCFGSRNDRTVLKTEAGTVTYTSPGIFASRNPTVSLEEFLHWAAGLAE
jgi:hypothetical protein